MTLTEKQAQQVQDLIGQGCSFRHIQRATGISRETIGKIANGTWGLKLESKLESKPELELDDIIPPDRTKRPVQCATHGLIYPPCLACQLVARANDSAEAEVEAQVEGTAQ